LGTKIIATFFPSQSNRLNSLPLLLQATFIITGNSKSVMNMSQADQVALWESVMKGTLQAETTTFDLSDVSQCRISTAIVLFVIR